MSICRPSLPNGGPFLAIGVAVAMILAVAGPASAHDPIFVSDDQTTPDTGPYMPDGTISWALYGTVLEATDQRGFEFDLRDGDELFISLLIPNVEPELSLGDDELPTLELETPSGDVLNIEPEIREVFDEEFSRTSYITLVELRQPGEGGRYRGTVIGNAPSRFTVAIGETEIFFTETERSGDRPGSFPEISAPLNAWYSTPPGGEPVETTADGEAEIQTDLIEEAMEGGMATDSREVDTAAEDGAGTAGVDDTDADVAAADSAESGTVDEADAAANDDADGGSNLIAPIALAAVVLAGAGYFLARRRNGADDATGVAEKSAP